MVELVEDVSATATTPAVQELMSPDRIRNAAALPPAADPHSCRREGATMYEVDHLPDERCRVKLHSLFRQNVNRVASCSLDLDLVARPCSDKRIRTPTQSVATPEGP